MTERFCPRCDAFQPHPHLEQLKHLTPKSKVPRYFFIDGHFDWNGHAVKKEWLHPIVKKMGECPQHTFPILSKRPELYDQFGLDYPRNVMLGATVTNEQGTQDWERIAVLRKYKNQKLVSFEPLLGSLPNDVSLEGLSWVIVGAYTGADEKRHRPDRAWVSDIVARSRKLDIAVFLKPTLGDSWKGRPIQNYP